MWSPKQKMWSPRLKNVESKIAFGQLILRKIIKTVATRCQILRLNAPKSKIRLGLRPRPRWESLQRSPDPLAGFKGPTSKGRGREWSGWEGTGRDGRGGDERGGECCGVQKDP